MWLFLTGSSVTWKGRGCYRRWREGQGREGLRPLPLLALAFLFCLLTCWLCVVLALWCNTWRAQGQVRRSTHMPYVASSALHRPTNFGCLLASLLVAMSAGPTSSDVATAVTASQAALDAGVEPLFTLGGGRTCRIAPWAVQGRRRLRALRRRSRKQCWGYIDLGAFGLLVEHTDADPLYVIGSVYVI